jgi:hypothetical protein
VRLRSGLVRPWRLVKVLLRHAEAEAKRRALWLGPVLFRAVPAAIRSPTIVDLHEPQTIRQRVQARTALLADDAARGPPRARRRLARPAGLVLVLPAKGVLAAVVRGWRRELLARGRRACRADGAATGPAVGGDAATCGFGVERVVAGEESLGGGAGEGGHRGGRCSVCWCVSLVFLVSKL